MRLGRVVVVALLVGPSLSGCVRASAKTVAGSPPLEMPPPPPRIVETVETTPQQPVTLIEEPARQPIRTPPVRSAPRADAAPQRPEPRVEIPVVEPSRVADEPPRPPTLQTTPAGAESEVERAIRAILGRANGDLSRVDYRVLNADARSQYDTAKRFIQQAEEALRPSRNLVFARNLADKAAALAAQLAGR